MLMHDKPQNDCAGLYMTSFRVYLVDMHLEIKLNKQKEQCLIHYILPF